MSNKFIGLLKETGRSFTDGKPLLMAAALSFYILLATGPILSIFIATIGTVYGEQKVQQQIVTGVEESAGPEIAQTVKMVIGKAYKSPSRFMSILSSVTLLLFGGTMVFYQTRRALNAVWGVDDKFEGGLLKKLKYYGASVLMLLIVGSLLVIMILKDPVIYGIFNVTDSIVDMPRATFQVINYIFSFVILTILFSLVYKILPEPDLGWKDVITGAAITAFLFTIVQILVGLSANNITSAFGAIGSFTLIFIWLFYSSLVFLFGATFTKVYAEKYGSIEMDGD